LIYERRTVCECGPSLDFLEHDWERSFFGRIDQWPRKLLLRFRERPASKPVDPSRSAGLPQTTCTDYAAVEPRPGGSVRTLTVMFADIAGFTGLSERLGDQIIPLLSKYLDIMSREVNSYGGTIDKFIGDAVMAFWGAPVTNADHAVDACRAALACQHSLRASGPTDDGGRPLKVRSRP
jgi:class 3 adenylate cyclase